MVNCPRDPQTPLNNQTKLTNRSLIQYQFQAIRQHCTDSTMTQLHDAILSLKSVVDAQSKAVMINSHLVSLRKEFLRPPNLMRYNTISNR
jgi:hypothetical protein